MIGGRGDGCLLFHFILSKIVAPHTCVQDYLRQFAGKGEPVNVQCSPFRLFLPFFFFCSSVTFEFSLLGFNKASFHSVELSFKEMNFYPN